MASTSTHSDTMSCDDWITTTLEQYKILSPAFTLQRATNKSRNTYHPLQSLWYKTEPTAFVETTDVLSFRQKINAASKDWQTKFFDAWIEYQLQLFAIHFGSVVGDSPCSSHHFQWLFLWLKHYEQHLVRFLPLPWSVIESFVSQYCNRVVGYMKVSLSRMHYPLIHVLLADVRKSARFEEKLVLRLWSRTLPNSVRSSFATREQEIADIASRFTGIVSRQLESSLSPFTTYMEKSIGGALALSMKKETWQLSKGKERLVFDSTFELSKLYPDFAKSVIDLHQPITFVAKTFIIWQQSLAQYVQHLFTKLGEFDSGLALECPTLAEIEFYCVMINSSTYFAMMLHKVDEMVKHSYPNALEHDADLRQEKAQFLSLALRSRDMLGHLVRRHVNYHSQSSMVTADWNNSGLVTESGVILPSKYVLAWSLVITAVVERLSERLIDVHWYLHECPTFIGALDNFASNMFAILHRVAIFFEQSIGSVKEAFPDNPNVSAQLKVDWSAIRNSLATAIVLSETNTFKALLSASDSQQYLSSLAIHSTRIEHQLDSPAATVAPVNERDSKQ